MCGIAIEKDDNTFITVSYDKTLNIWNKTSCECLSSLPMSNYVYGLLKTKDSTRFVCGLGGGGVEMRLVSNLGLISSFKIHDNDYVMSMCELEDGSFVSGARSTMRRWNETGTVLQTFSGHSDSIQRVIELKRHHREWIKRQNSEDVVCVNRRMSSHFDSSFWLGVWTGKGEGWIVCEWVERQKDGGVG